MSTTRRYQSDLRSAQAQQTRQRIRASARLLFEGQGFAATTVAQIASEAGVSTPTVYAVFGSKAAILREMMDELEGAAGGEDTAGSLLAEADPRRQLAMFAHWIRTLFEVGAPLFRAAQAARHDPDVEAFIETGNARRLEGTTMLTRGWGRAGALRPGLTQRRAAQSLWLLTSAELYLAATSTLGWSAQSYESWLVSTATHELFGET